LGKLPRSPALNVFGPVDELAWRAKAQRDLGGRSLASLGSTTPEKIRLDVVYWGGPADGLESLPGQGAHLRGATAFGPHDGTWTTCQEYRLVDAKDAGRAAAADVERGASAVWFCLASSEPAGSTSERDLDGCGEGLELRTKAEAEDFVASLPTSLDTAGIRIECGASAKVLADWLGVDRVTLLADPIGTLARVGSINIECAQAFDELAVRIKQTPAGRAHVLISTTPYENSGSSDALALACGLSTAVAYLRVLEDRAISPRRAAASLQFRVGIGRDLFAGIAKLRALRSLWSRVAASCQLQDCSAHVHACSAWHDWSREDPWNNLMRGTVGTLAAAIGGADSIATSTFDRLMPRGSELGTRLACNTQVLLREESHLDRVIDAAGGSDYVESLTDALARKAWSRFQDLESRGGMLDALQSGYLQAQIHEEARWRRQQVATRNRPVVGVSKYPSFEPTPLSEIEGCWSQRRSCLGENGLPPTVVASVQPLIAWRSASPFERLRCAVEAHCEDRGVARPQLFLACVGATAEHQARGDFAAELFAAAGIGSLRREDYPELKQAIEEFSNGPSCLVCICGSDQAYTEMAAGAVAQFGDAGARMVYIAGTPPEEPIAGAVYIHHQSDALAMLTDALVRLEIEVKL